MNAFLNQLFIQLKVDFRDKGMLLVFYILPLIFYIVMGAVFSSVNPDSKQTLSSAMSVFSLTMGAVVGIPQAIVKLREAGVFRTYRVNGISESAALLSVGISAFIHLGIVAVFISVTAPLFFGAQIPKNIGLYIAVLVVMLLCKIAIGLLIGVTAKSYAACSLLSQLIFLPSVMVGGIMFPSSLLPELLGAAGKALPATHAMRAFEGLAYGIDTAGNAAISFAVLCGLFLIIFTLTAWRFKKIIDTK